MATAQKSSTASSDAKAGTRKSIASKVKVRETKTTKKK